MISCKLTNHCVDQAIYEVNPVRNSSRCDFKPSGALNPARIILKCNYALGRTAEQQGIISNGVKGRTKFPGGLVCLWKSKKD